MISVDPARGTRCLLSATAVAAAATAVAALLRPRRRPPIRRWKSPDGRRQNRIMTSFVSFQSRKNAAFSYVEKRLLFYPKLSYFGIFFHLLSWHFRHLIELFTLALTFFKCGEKFEELLVSSILGRERKTRGEGGSNWLAPRKRSFANES
jgi:hypothetical protein